MRCSLLPLAAILSPIPLRAADGSLDAPAETAGPPFVWNSINRGSLRAIIQPAQDIRLSARASGIIRRYEAQEGTPIAKDAAILVLDDEQERAELAQAEAMLKGAQAELAHAEGEFERAKPLSEEKIFSSKQFAEAKYALELARSRVAQAQATLAIARVKLADRTVVSPIDGIFLKRAKNVGEAIERFEPIARIVDLSHLEITVYCDASLFGAFKERQLVSVQVSKSEAGHIAVVEGTVSYVDPIIDPASGTFRTRVRLPRSEVTAPGYTAILIPPGDSTAVPSKSG